MLKALFDRPKDRVDIGEMLMVSSVDVALALDILSGFDADDAVERLRPSAGSEDTADTD